MRGPRLVIPIDRDDAARRLRAVRRAEDDATRSAAIDRACAALPDLRVVRRLAIQDRLDRGAIDEAERLLEQGLLAHPTDPALARIRAACRLERRDPRQAQREIAIALRQRPHHVGTRLLAARVATALGDHTRAVALLESTRAARRRRREADGRPATALDRRLDSALVLALIDAGIVRRAARLIEAMPDAPAVPWARLLTARGQRSRAIGLLASRVNHGPAEERAAIACELIDLLEPTGQSERLRRLLDATGPDQPRVLVRAGEAWLRRGDFRRAACRLARLRHDPKVGRDALSVVMVAATHAGRPRLAERALHRLRRHPAGPDACRLADLWRRALAARTFRAPCTAPALPAALPADADRVSVLRPLARRALEVLERPVTDPAEAAARRAARAACRRVLRRRDAVPADRVANPDPAVPPAAPDHAETAPAPLPFPSPFRRAA
ncbi:MAG: hypothetical protein ACYTG1_04570 [Planctomycetota bacterium]